MDKQKFRHIKLLENGITHYTPIVKQFTKEEIEELDKKYFEEAQIYIKQALEDGYIEFPVMWENGPNEVYWSSCYLPPNFLPSHSKGFKEKFGMNYNIYIPSYKRAGIAYTNKMLDFFGITNYYFCVDPDQYPAYKEAYGIDKVIIRDHTFKKDEKLNRLTSVPVVQSWSGGAAFMNALLYMTKSLGDKKYWMLDDDIMLIALKAPKKPIANRHQGYIYNKDDYYRCSNLLSEDLGFSLRELMADLEDYSDSCENIGSLALEKMGITFDKPVKFLYGTRAYSFFLANAEHQPDEEGQQNNDTLNSCTENRMGRVVTIFEGYNYDTPSTQEQKGGLQIAYSMQGTLDKGKILVVGQPNAAKISYLNSRIHHVVNYAQFGQVRLLGKCKK